jgi:hypothetical protein
VIFVDIGDIDDFFPAKAHSFVQVFEGFALSIGVGCDGIAVRAALASERQLLGQGGAVCRL